MNYHSRTDWSAVNMHDPASADSLSGDGEDQDQLLQDVQRWLATTGYPFEMQVAATLKRGFPNSSITQGVSYEDAQTGTLREIDVVVHANAGNSERMHYLSAYIECKNTSTPWIVFESDSAPPLPTVWQDEDCGFCERWSYSAEFELDAMEVIGAYGIVEKRAERDKSEKNLRDMAHKGVLSALSSAAGDIYMDQSREFRPFFPHGALLIPAVVTNSPLIACRLGEDGKPELRRISAARVTTCLSNMEDEHCVLVANLDTFVTILQKIYGHLLRLAKLEDSGAIIPSPEQALRERLADPAVLHPADPK